VKAWWQRARSPFDPDQADENGLVALGGSLEPDLVLLAYREGVFPWSSDPVISWWSPDPRALFDLATWKAHRSIGQAVRRGDWHFSVDKAFEQVMRACAAPAPGRESTWIGEDFIKSYVELHGRGFAHSVEVWEGEELVGGLYGVTLGGFFGGESMFNRRTDASKAAVMHLIERLRASGFVLCDAQVPTPHLSRLGAVELPRQEYLAKLKQALKVEATFT
jgi:leucyl/phenylalanyl-tRNA---protein transferase